MLNPDQFSLPGLEDYAQSPALARALSKGYSFEAEHGVVLAHRHDEPFMSVAGDRATAGLWWNATNKRDERLAPGSVGLVETMPGHRRRGLGEAMYDLARTGQYGRKVRHDIDRTTEGDAFARGLQAKGKGGLVPKSDREKYMEKNPEFARRLREGEIRTGSL